jgi:hypothetical protein
MNRHGQPIGVLILALIGSAAGSSPQLEATLEKKTVRRLAIYYGYPSLINGAGGDVSRATEAFSPYDVIVLGDGLQFGDRPTGRPQAGPGRDEHERAVEIVARLRETARSREIYGYVGLGNTQHLALAEIEERVALWAAMGATGIFFDEAGQDYGVSRERLEAAVRFAHERDLNVCVNAFDPADVLGPRAPSTGSAERNAAPVDTPLLPGDAVLLESFAVRLGIRQPSEDVIGRAQRAIAMASARGIRTFGVATGRPDGSFDREAADYAWALARQSGLDAFGWSEPEYGASTSRLALRSGNGPGARATRPMFSLQPANGSFDAGVLLGLRGSSACAWSFGRRCAASLPHLMR